MRIIPDVCDALTLAGVGLLLWLGLGMPSVAGLEIAVVVALLVSLIMSRPAFELAQQRTGAMQRIRARFGRFSVYLVAGCLVLLAIYVAQLERLNRNAELGKLITFCGTLALFIFGHHRARRLGRAGLERVFTILLTLGYAGTAGALLAGQVQFGIVAVSALALTQIFDWFVFARVKPCLAGGILAFVIPLLMLSTLQIGHGLAIPLILSFTWGMALILRSGEAEYPRRQEQYRQPPAT